jgi:hypothetical protein
MVMSFIKKNTNYFLMLLLMFCSLNVFAEEMPYRVFETDSLSIKLSNDGTGIVQGIKCEGCDFKFVRITENSKASKDGVEVNIMEAREQAGKFVMVSFNPETQEVQYIRW